ncbi:MAG: hypothetical protein QGH23_09275 [Dehalococcoidia bacterium]|jgi:hypothetical protein|nr:hypothetical protein [Dehalococcoidia bacterium]MDP6783169.1 hypothetical protein [Dehalococcoidia bacterium]
MPNTKTLRIRLAPSVISDLERLRGLFAFASYGEVLESMVCLLQDIDAKICATKGHPRDWEPEYARGCFGVGNGYVKGHPPELESLLPLRLKEKFGEGGI